MYNEDGQFEPTDGRDYKMMLETDLDKEVKEIEEKENPAKDDGLDDLVVGPDEEIV